MSLSLWETCSPGFRSPPRLVHPPSLTATSLSVPGFHAWPLCGLGTAPGSHPRGSRAHAEAPSLCLPVMPGRLQICIASCPWTSLLGRPTHASRPAAGAELIWAHPRPAPVCTPSWERPFSLPSPSHHLDWRQEVPGCLLAKPPPHSPAGTLPFRPWAPILSGLAASRTPAPVPLPRVGARHAPRRPSA